MISDVEVMEAVGIVADYCKERKCDGCALNILHRRCVGNEAMDFLEELEADDD